MSGSRLLPHSAWTLAIPTVLPRTRAARGRKCCCHHAVPRSGQQAAAYCCQETWKTPLTDPAEPGLPPIIALGKFDAMHKGHRALCMQAAAMGGQPWMLSFSGMGEVLGWPPRLPLVADSDRPRVLASWAGVCKGRTPRQHLVPFTAVRQLSPEDFVALLAEDLRVGGIVVGENYRFGYKAAGDAKLLQELGQRRGIPVAITELLGAGIPGRVGQVSSSKIRSFLGAGRMTRVEELLGRKFRLVAHIPPDQVEASARSLRVPPSCFQNQPPLARKYPLEACTSTSAGHQQSFAGGELDLAAEGCPLLHLPSDLLLQQDAELHLAMDF